MSTTWHPGQSVRAFRDGVWRLSIVDTVTVDGPVVDGKQYTLHGILFDADRHPVGMIQPCTLAEWDEHRAKVALEARLDAAMKTIDGWMSQALPGQLEAVARIVSAPESLIVRVRWSEDGGVYIAQDVAQPGLTAHGSTMAEALREMAKVVEMVETDGGCDARL